MSGRIGSDFLKTYVDADACPVIKIVEYIANKVRRSFKKNHLKGPAKRTQEEEPVGYDKSDLPFN